MSKKPKHPLDVVNHEIARLEALVSNKAHGPTSDEQKLLQKLSELYGKRRTLKEWT